jgi:organic radical activating enzyme
MNVALNRIPYDFDGFSSFAIDNKAPVFIFGADIVGKVLAELLKSNGIAVSAFIDNNKNKCDTQLNGTPVMHAPWLADQSREAVVLIASTYIADIIAQLEEMGFMNWLPIYKMLEDKQDIQLENFLVGDLRFNHSGGAFTHDFDTFVLSNMITSQKKYLDPEQLYIRSIDLVITEKCSLKCKDCSNLMQFYEKPVDISAVELYQNLDDLCAVADEINEIRIIGGDPFMNKDCHNIVKHAASYPQVNKVVVYTNGTICPSEEKIAQMANDKTFVFITTYGDLSRNAEKLSQLLAKYDIPFNNQPAYGWTDCGEIKEFQRNEEELKKVFQFCCAKHFTTLTDGKLFRCPFAANLHRLDAMPENKANYVSVIGASKLESTERLALKQKMTHYLREISSIPACNTCNGRTYGDPEIEPGIQTKKPLPYKKYNRVIEIKSIS